MKYKLTQEFIFESAHSLLRYADHVGEDESVSSKRIHGHTYHAEVTVAGGIDPRTGMLIDLKIFRLMLEKVKHQLDHHLLDDVPGLGPATLEGLCGYIARELAPLLPGLEKVTVARRASGDKCELLLID